MESSSDLEPPSGPGRSFRSVLARWPGAGRWGIAALVGLVPALAYASNTGKPRVPPSFLGVRCIETIDRSVDPVWRFDVGIPFEDTGLTDDEPPDSRTFQFVGLCRAPGPLEVLPPWLDAADAMAAAAVDPTIELPEPGQTLADSADWADCVQWITPASERIPITCAATTAGASWDTTGVPAGAHAIWGYTYEPAQNLWTPRDGVVRVIDGDDASAGPAVSFSWPLTEVTAGLDEGVRVAGCVAGMEGTIVTVSWASASALESEGDLAWEIFAEDEWAETFEVALMPPPEAEYEAIFLRAEAADPQGRRFVAYTREPVVFLSGCESPQGGARSLPDDCGIGSGSPLVPPGSRGAGGCEEGSGSVDETGGGPEGTGATASGSGSGAGGETGEPAASGGDDRGCSCRTSPGRWPLPGALAFVLVVAGWRGRRGDATLF